MTRTVSLGIYNRYAKFFLHLHSISRIPVLIRKSTNSHYVNPTKVIGNARQ